jgi:hypothetical protein
METCKDCEFGGSCVLLHKSDSQTCNIFTHKKDYAEVVHAHWEDGSAIQNGKEVYKSIDCSHCEEVLKIESETREYWKARFKVCPFCGAVMDGGNKDG